MLREIGHDDVVELHGSTRASRLGGYAVSAYVVRDVLIDTGFPRIGAALDAWRQQRAPLRGVVLTHWHEDHAGNVERVARAGLPIDASDATLAPLRTPAALAAYRRFTWGSPLPLRTTVTPFADPSLERIATPGHSADHHVVWDHETGTVFGGDLFIGIKVRIAHHDEDHRATIASLRAIARRAPARYFDAHRGLVTDPVRALHAKADWMEATVSEIERRVHAGESDDRVRRAVLGREDATGLSSFGEYSKRSYVEAVRRRMTR
ncbi:MAG: MBL fold metallo-hydrolase [Gemmatimonadaceae bacterium]|jgi:glyoxylase-like metal-dependent hydrolase (beta-lactamase superfamily II)|nr:MBL fold metallo-hydrolase [Gemmatimonadaceae bacterium]